jgi:epoxyqueuosine reductase QueG
LPAWIAKTVTDFSATSPANSLTGKGGESAWGTPLVGFSRGDDPYYPHFKADIGPFLWTPEEAFALGCPTVSATADELSVISWILPQTAATLADQRAETELPAERWCRSRHFGEAFNEVLRRHMVAALAQIGIAAVAPALLPHFAYQVSERYGLASNWSERHVAFVSGLGTFGLSDGLITPVGKAMRCGSVVARVRLPATAREYRSHQAWCLYYTRGTCQVCARRCPAGAISEAGHDKHKCHAYIREVTAVTAKSLLGVEVTPCGLCQVKIPCEREIPPLLRTE